MREEEGDEEKGEERRGAPSANFELSEWGTQKIKINSHQLIIQKSSLFPFPMVI